MIVSLHHRVKRLRINCSTSVMIFETVTICNGIRVELNRAALASGLQFPRIIRWKRWQVRICLRRWHMRQGSSSIFFLSSTIWRSCLLVNSFGSSGHASRFIMIFFKIYIKRDWEKIKPALQIQKRDKIKGKNFGNLERSNLILEIFSR